MSLRERLAAKAGIEPGKLPVRQDALYDKPNIGTGKALGSSELAVLKGSLGQRRRRGGFGGSDSDDDADDYGGLNEMHLSQKSRAGLQRPRDAGQQRTAPNAAGPGQAASRAKPQQRVIADSDSDNYDEGMEVSSSEPDWDETAN